GTLKLVDEVFKHTKTGLSSFAKNPKEVYKVFKDSPFKVSGPSSVSILDGLYEGIYAWITVNFLTGRFSNKDGALFGALDLGGGSTQITFHPVMEFLPAALDVIIEFKFRLHVGDSGFRKSIRDCRNIDCIPSNLEPTDKLQRMRPYTYLQSE
ncbi:hypothetical protein QZH41_010712, partial [Actinostola sp. cb2023]